MSGPLAAAEARARARLRARTGVLGAAAAAHTVAVVAFAATLGAEAGSAVTDLVLVGGVALALVLTSGVVSGELRSGVALLWLQKPVSPLRFYLARWSEAAALVLLCGLAVSGWSALVTLGLAGPDAGREVLVAAPGVLVLALCLAAVVFACSGWGAHPDVVLAIVLVLYLVWLDVGAARGWGAAAGWEPARTVVGWAALPIDELERLSDFFAGHGTAGAADAAAETIGHLLFWVAVGCAGTAVTTRSPLPREQAR